LGKKILIVEDNPDTRDLLALLLTKQGYTVQTASDGKEGLKLIQADRPDLVITDINMPHISGVELINLARRLPECATLPIIVMTAYGSGKASDALSAGADEAVKKPLDYEAFIDGINELLK
jgi:CheY-like chemotaxis protein